MIRFSTQDDAVTFSVRAQPRAPKSKIVGEIEGVLKIRLAAPPVDGAANEEMIYFLAKFFAVSRQSIEIIFGATAKNKIVRVHGITGEQFLAKLSAG